MSYGTTLQEDRAYVILRQSGLSRRTRRRRQSWTVEERWTALRSSAQGGSWDPSSGTTVGIVQTRMKVYDTNLAQEPVIADDEAIYQTEATEEIRRISLRPERLRDQFKIITDTYVYVYAYMCV